MAITTDCTDVELRWSPYIWPTWLSGLIAGDKHCWWSAWLRAHFRYTKLESDNDMLQWKAAHQEMVATRTSELRAAGWAVSTESQNKIQVKGETATLGACPDILAVKPDNAVAVEDCKTGRMRDGDFWQVLLYMFLLTLPRARFHGVSVEGRVLYRESERVIYPSELTRGRQLILGAIKTAADAIAPARVPSKSECERCDIAGCPDRYREPEAAAIETTEF